MSSFFFFLMKASLSHFSPILAILKIFTSVLTFLGGKLEGLSEISWSEFTHNSDQGVPDPGEGDGAPSPEQEAGGPGLDPGECICLFLQDFEPQLDYFRIILKCEVPSDFK